MPGIADFFSVITGAMQSPWDNKASKGLMQQGCWNGSYLIKKMGSSWYIAEMLPLIWRMWFRAYFGTISWSHLIEVSILWMNLYRVAQQKLWTRMVLWCCLRHLSFTEIARYPVGYLPARSVSQPALWGCVTDTPGRIFNLPLQTTI